MSYLSPAPDNNSEDLEDRLQELEFLQLLDSELTQVLDVNYVLDITLDWAMRRTAADTGIIARNTPLGLKVLRVTGYAYQMASELMKEPLSISDGILGRVATSGKPVYMAYVTKSSEQQVVYDQARSQFTVPLLIKNEVMGVLHLESRHPAHFSHKMRSFLQHVSRRAAIALHNAELYTKVHQSEQLKSDMIRMVAHDLRNPLNTIVNALHLLKRLQSQMPESTTRFVQSIDQSANNMRSLIEELLTLERLESGIEITPDPIELAKVLHEAVSRIKRDADSKSQDIVIKTPDLPMIVRGEFAYFRQVMVNLISNAIKYTPHRGKITVRLEQHGLRAFFDVTDTGYGISEERQKRLGQRFYRAEEPGTEHIEGTGLGLSLVKTIIERSHGNFWFKSEQGKGSTFGFWLPINEDDIPEDAQAATDQAIEDSMFKAAADTITKGNTTPPPRQFTASVSDDEDEDTTMVNTITSRHDNGHNPPLSAPIRTPDQTTGVNGNGKHDLASSTTEEAASLKSSDS
jgi:signal transduction histidine kinase